MFLIRAAFWLSVVIMFIPADPQTETPAPRVTVVNALVAGQAAVADLANFCDRNPDICVTGNAALRIFSEKAQNGARLLYQFLDKNFDTPDVDDEQGTLTGADRAPDWRAPRDDSTA